MKANKDNCILYNKYTVIRIREKKTSVPLQKKSDSFWFLRLHKKTPLKNRSLNIRL